MNQEMKRHFRQRLETLRDALRARLIQEGENTQPVAPDRAIGRLTRQEAIQAQQISLELQRRQRVQLQQVLQALRRIDEGVFGLCLRCKEEIGRARLEARPEAHLCVRCADSL